MKVGVYFDGYEPFHEQKEGNLVMGLVDAGADAAIVTLAKSGLAGHEPPYPVLQASPEDVRDPAYWRALDVDAILAYTFLNWHYNPILHAIRASGKTLVVRSDSDGRIGPPVNSRRWMFGAITTREGMRNRLRRLAWRVAPRRLAEIRLAHFILPHAFFIESPGALANVSAFLDRWNRADLVSKFTVIPMTISSEFVTASLEEKEPSVVAVGRWVDERQKNSTVAVRILRHFLAERPAYRAALIGAGADRFRSSADERLTLLEHVPQRGVRELVARARILFMPSNWEGFPLVAGEAVCMGCSLSGTPIESLDWLTMEGRFGTLAPNFRPNAILRALIDEADAWDAGRRDPRAIADHWRPRLDRATVGRQLLALIDSANARRNQHP